MYDGERSPQFNAGSFARERCGLVDKRKNDAALEFQTYQTLPTHGSGIFEIVIREGPDLID